MLVHLPIGFLLLAILLEWGQKRREQIKIRPFISYAWLLGAISAGIAALCGWLLAESGNYVEDDIFWHRWLGICLALAALSGWWIKSRPGQFSRPFQHAATILVIGLVLLEGHLGGSITHGDDYLLEYAPEPVQKLFAESKLKNSLPQLEGRDTILVYDEMIYPILKAKCATCHNTDERRGALNMTDVEDFKEGGENGPVLLPGNAPESELFRRVTLPRRNEKYMPPRGEPLTYDEIKVLEWWIAQGADFDTSLKDVGVVEAIQPVILRLYGLDSRPRPWYESVGIPAVDSVQLRVLRRAGFSVNSLGEGNPLLDVSFSGGVITEEQLLKLEIAKEHITWLSLAQTNVEDEWLSIVSEFPNLTRLELEKTGISDKGIIHLTNLKHLEALNLYGTAITDASLDHLKSIPGLKRLYVWGTRVSEQGVKELMEGAPELEVIAGVNAN